MFLNNLQTNMTHVKRACVQLLVKIKKHELNILKYKCIKSNLYMNKVKIKQLK